MIFAPREIEVPCDYKLTLSGVMETGRIVVARQRCLTRRGVEDDAILQTIVVAQWGIGIVDRVQGA